MDTTTQLLLNYYSTTTQLLLNYCFTSRQYRGLTISRIPLENSIKISSTASLIFPK